MTPGSAAHSLLLNARDPRRSPRPENRLGLDYARAAGLLPEPACPIVDIHSHLNGPGALAIYSRVAAIYGVRKALTMVRLSDAASVRSVLGDFVEFIAFPDFRAPDRVRAFTEGFLEDIQAFHDRFNSRMIKLWNAPRVYEMFPGAEGRALVAFDGAWRVRQVSLARSLGMGVMVHVADPDSWFKARYVDASIYPPKREQYEGLERLLDRFSDVPFLGAHMGGYPEDLGFLDGLLSRHPNFHIDTSATKWIVRELSRHPRSRVIEFFDRWQDRICFGSDIVSTDEHLSRNDDDAHAPAAPAPGFNTGKTTQVRHPMAHLAEDEETAFDLYASRYFVLRLMFETDYEGESPIADPDLRMEDPSITDPLAAPRVRGLALSRERLQTLYRGAGGALLSRMGLRV